VATPRKAVAQAFYVDKRGRSGRVQLVHRGSEDHICAMNLGERAVGLQGARIDRVILVRPELGGVHEDADCDLVAGSSSRSYQGRMTGVQSAHGGHKADAVTALAAFPGPLAEFGYGVQNLHQAFLNLFVFRGISSDSRSSGER
jgi:hypothetical protein